MSFLAPYMLLGTVAAAIPIVLHLFFRSRYRTVPWAAMKFLLASIEQTSRRLRFQELLLLIMRCALLALLALALARPLSTVVRGAGQGDAVDAVFVFDTSFSMSAGDGATNRLGRAKEAALKIIDQLPNHSTVQIITCADRASLLGPRVPANLDQARHLIQTLQLGSLSSDLYPGVVEAASVLQRGQSSNKELYVFSDMQALAWDQQAGNLKGSLQEIKEKAAVFLVRCGTRAPASAALVGITPQSGVPRPGDRVGFAVLVRNTGKEALKDLKISLAVDGNDKLAETQSLPRLDPGQTRAVTLTARLEKAGLRTLTARLDHDDLPGDNRFDQVVLVRDQVNILVVDGGVQDRDPEKWSSFNLMNALLPVKDTERAKYHLQPRLVTPRLAAPALLAKTDLCILVNVALQADPARPAEVLAADFVEELGRFVRQGKGLVIYAGDHVAPEPYNRILGKKHGLLPLPIKGVQEHSIKSPIKLNPNSAGLPAFWKFRDDDYYKGLKDVEVYKALELDETHARKDPEKAEGEAKEKKQDPLTVVFRYSDGKPAVAARLVEEGQVLLIGTAADRGWKRGSPDPTWTDWPIHFEFVPFVDLVVSHLLQGQTQTYNLVAGQKLDWFPTEKVERAYALTYPDGTTVRLGLPEKQNNRAVVTASDLPLGGIYRMVTMLPPRIQADEAATEAPPDRTAGVPIAVVPDLRESLDLTTLAKEQINERLGFEPIHMTAGVEGATEAADRLNREWTTWLLIAVLILAVCEALLATWCGRAW